LFKKESLKTKKLKKKFSKGLLINLTISEKTTLENINDIGEIFCNKLDEDSNIVWSAKENKKLKNIQIINFFVGVNFSEK
jgi:cell division GTPase FtsZ